MTSERCDDSSGCTYQEPHRHGRACDKTCGRCKDQRCQHCYRPVRLMPSEDPGAPDRAIDKRGEPVCMPATASPVLHKVMPVVS